MSCCPFFHIATHSCYCPSLCRHTLKIVLRGEWPKLAPASKTHLGVTLTRCISQLVQHPAASRCTTLQALANNPWTHPVLDSILNGQPDSEHEEGKKRRIITISMYNGFNPVLNMIQKITYHLIISSCAQSWKSRLFEQVYLRAPV